mmetsp:Transcript_16955/g.46544  ORF Transcript_16955/g.46544 Transcript_16955/m.46544 type:complete len:361 (+) Transcript_16955:354-1436(+)
MRECIVRMKVSSEHATIKPLKPNDHATVFLGLSSSPIATRSQPMLNRNFVKHVHATVEVFGVGDLYNRHQSKLGKAHRGTQQGGFIRWKIQHSMRMFASQTIRNQIVSTMADIFTQIHNRLVLIHDFVDDACHLFSHYLWLFVFHFVLLNQSFWRSRWNRCEGNRHTIHHFGQTDLGFLYSCCKSGFCLVANLLPSVGQFAIARVTQVFNSLLAGSLHGARRLEPCDFFRPHVRKLSVRSGMTKTPRQILVKDHGGSLFGAAVIHGLLRHVIDFEHVTGIFDAIDRAERVVLVGVMKKGLNKPVRAIGDTKTVVRYTKHHRALDVSVSGMFCKSYRRQKMMVVQGPVADCNKAYGSILCF